MSTVTPMEKRSDAYSIPLSEFDVSNPKLFQDNTVETYFARLRAEEPVHYCPKSKFGSYWSVTKYRDIISVDSNHKVYSSEASLGGPTLIDGRESFQRDRFMAMDPPKHGEQRKVVAPVVGPANLAKMESVIRERAEAILDGLPINVEFDWVDRVSIELTTQILAMLFDFPWDDRRMLAHWSNVAMAIPESGIVSSEAAREEEIMECYHYFRNLWDERAKLPPQNDFVSAMAHSKAMRDMPMNEFIGNIILLIVGGNDTTRSALSGGVLALNENPSEYDKLRQNHELVGNMVSEIIRWQTPLSHMRRTAVQDAELGGKTIRKGDKVVMWYLSGNRDEDAIENAKNFVIDRKNARQHLSFGFGIHRCFGSRLAEMQLRVLWEEILKRFSSVDVMGQPIRTYSNFVHGFEALPVRIPKRF